MSTRAAIESALIEDPDDLASHAAYADLLHEEGDPRGDLIQAQLALEDPSLKPAERRRLRKVEGELLKRHWGGWLGPLAPFLLDNQGGTGASHRFSRGWVASLTVPYLTGPFANAIVESDLTLLTELHLESSAIDHPFRALNRSKRFHALRVLKLGKDADDDGAEMMFPLDGAFPAGGLGPFLAKSPHVEELHLWLQDHGLDATDLFRRPLPRLRYLKLYHVSREHPLAALADNPTLGRLTHLLFQPSRMTAFTDDPASFFEDNPYTPEGIAALARLPALTHLQLRMSKAGDDGVRALIDSGLLARLERCDLQYGLITDTGARLIADAAMPRMKRLVLTDNRMTDEGLALLAGRPTIEAGGQWGGDAAYYEVQFE